MPRLVFRRVYPYKSFRHIAVANKKHPQKAPLEEACSAESQNIKFQYDHFLWPFRFFFQFFVEPLRFENV